MNINHQIRAPKVRVIGGASGAQLGVLSTPTALRMAKEQGLDLVEVASTVDPPVCKIIDYANYKYQVEKHKKEAHKATKLKEMKFRIGIDPHDYLIKITHAEDFLADGHKVRIQLQFRGRQMAHQELGDALASRIIADLVGVGHPDTEPKMAGRNTNLQLSPHPEPQRVRKFRIPGDENPIPQASPLSRDSPKAPPPDEDGGEPPEPTAALRPKGPRPTPAPLAAATAESDH